MPHVLREAILIFFIVVFVVEFILALYAYKLKLKIDWTYKFMSSENSLLWIVSARVLYLISYFEFISVDGLPDSRYIDLAYSAVLTGSVVHLGMKIVEKRKTMNRCSSDA